MNNANKNVQNLTFSNKFRQFLAFQGPQGGFILCHQSVLQLQANLDFKGQYLNLGAIF